MKRNLLLLASACLVFFNSLSPLYSQDNETSNFSIGADVVSRYVWRGLNLGGSSPHVQPYMEYAFGESGLAVGAWGSYSLGPKGSGTYATGIEADLYVSYSPVDWLGFTVTDYFFPKDEAFESNDYFNYDADETGHTIEAMVTIGGFESFPVYATFAVNIFGVVGTNAMGEKYNAKYLELGYSSSIKEYDFSAFAGLALDDPKFEDEAEGGGFYGNKSTGLINLGISLGKEYTIADKAIPVSSSLIFNPEAGNIFLVFGISF
jgi:hypothetical protein